mmetsp:Transcript_23061/g.34994  ORF Transcript_23061/g.34994 Transcript_23061/m.34994 type:complete len:196 (+) Transcript_23061:23-610(+)
MRKLSTVELHLSSPVKMAVQKIKPANKKRVSFFETVVVHEVLHRRDMSEEEISNSWHTRDEMNVVKKEILREMHMILAGKKGSAGFSFRGLECRMREENQRRRAIKTNSIFAVLEEQDNQFIKEVYNPRAIRKIYQDHSIKCQRDAEYLGNSDALEARKLASEDSLLPRLECNYGHFEGIRQKETLSPCSFAVCR